MPVHSHTYNCGAGSKGETNVIASQVNCDEQTGTQEIYATTSDGSVMGPGMVQPTAGQPHENMQPYVAVTFIIAMQGVFPARN